MTAQFQCLPVKGLFCSYTIPQICVVGQEFIQGVTTWPEGTIFDYTAAGGCRLLLIYRHPTTREKDAFSGPARFALVSKYGLIFLHFKFGDMPWQNAPYSYWLVPEEIRPDPEADLNKPGNRLFLNCFFINAATGILEEMRVMTFSPQFTTQLLQCVKEQAQRTLTIEEQSLSVALINSQYPTPKAMVSDALVQCWGGD
jgi:hypothetical protein